MNAISLEDLRAADTRTLARAISLVENGRGDFLSRFPSPEKQVPVIGITGPPGAGKSTLVDKLIGQLVEKDCRVAVLCVDPSSPFHQGALLGDRIRLSDWYRHEKVFIRSLASRGAVGGLHPQIIEICQLLCYAPFDYIIVETVGVGQNEVAIASLADISVVVLVPESGDDIQALKSGIMEIADIFVVNKSDRPDASVFVANLRKTIAGHLLFRKQDIPIIQTIATRNGGISELFTVIRQELQQARAHKLGWLMTERAYVLITQARMRDVSKKLLQEEIELLLAKKAFDLHEFVRRFI